MHTRILQAPYALVRRAKRVIAREVEVLEEPAGTEIIVAPREAAEPMTTAAVIVGVQESAEAPPPDAVVLPGELPAKRRTHRRPRYRLAQVGCILSAAGSVAALIGLALEEGPLAKIGAGAALLSAVAAIAFAWRSRMKTRVMELALAAGAVAVLMCAAVVMLGDGGKPTEPQGKPTTVSPGAKQGQQ